MVVVVVVVVVVVGCFPVCCWGLGEEKDRSYTFCTLNQMETMYTF
jgi:hypothetical protein